MNRKLFGYYWEVYLVLFIFLLIEFTELLQVCPEMRVNFTWYG